MTDMVSKNFLWELFQKLCQISTLPRNPGSTSRSRPQSLQTDTFGTKPALAAPKYNATVELRLTYANQESMAISSISNILLVTLATGLARRPDLFNQSN
ncbi:hypothetical protein ACHAXS_001498 [Conticribra weissflogii]